MNDLRETSKLLRHLCRMVSGTISLRYMLAFFLLPGVVVAELGLFPPIVNLERIWRSITQVFHSHHKIRPPSMEIFNSAWLHGVTYSIPRVVFTIWGPAILALGLAWVTAMALVKSKVESNRVRNGALSGALLAALTVCLLSTAIAAGMPEYHPLVLFIGLVTLQSIVGMVMIPVAISMQYSADLPDPDVLVKSPDRPAAHTEPPMTPTHRRRKQRPTRSAAGPSSD